MSNTNLEICETREFTKKPSRTIFIIGMAIILLSIVIKNLTPVNLPPVIILALCCALAFVSDRDELLTMVIVCIPLSAAFQYKYFILAATLIYILKFGKDIKYKHGIIPLLLMMALELAHGAFFTFSLYLYLRNFAELIFCTVFLMCEHKRIDYKLIVRTLAISSLVMMTIVLLNLLKQTGYNFQAIFEGTYRFGVGNEETVEYGINYNANKLGFIANLSIAGLLQLNLAKIGKKIDYVIILMLALFGILTMSRTFLLISALIITLFIFSTQTSLITRTRNVLLIAIFIIAIFFFVKQTMPFIISRFTERFMVDDISNGRAGLFAFYTDHIFSSLKYMLVGIGLQNYGDRIFDIYGSFENVCHNGPQEVIVCWGFIGLGLFIWYIYELISGTKKTSTRKLINFIPIIITSVAVQAGQLISNGDILLRFTLCAASLLWNPQEA